MPPPTSRSCAGQRIFYYAGARPCCQRISVGNDPTGWYHATISSFEPSYDGLSTVRFKLFFWDIFATPRMGWHTLHWSDLSPMHGRRIHISAVAEDLSAAWHLHVDEATTSTSALLLTAQLDLRPVLARRAQSSGELRLRLLFNFGVLSDRVGLCVDESASHVDPGPGGQQLVIEGHAVSAAVVVPLPPSAPTVGDGLFLGGALRPVLLESFIF